MKDRNEDYGVHAIISNERSGHDSGDWGMFKDITTREEVKELRGQNLGTIIYVNFEISKNFARKGIKGHEKE